MADTLPVADALAHLARRWRDASPSERANAQLYLSELCAALGVEKPRPAGTGYEFEHPVRIVHRDGSEAVNRVDLFKQGCFLLEAKDEGAATTSTSTSTSSELRLRRAFGQASSYAAFVTGGPPPYLMVLDVGRTLRVWDRWSGSYGGFQGAVRTVELARLAERPDDVAFLRAVWEDPASLDPNARAAAVTKEIAGKLATLASRLEQGGQDQERVARFLIRCVFTMFAEDVGLLDGVPFERAVEMGMEDPERFARAVAGLWQAMDEGGDFGLLQVLRFNGHFFHDRDVIPLERDDLAVLLEAARADWAHVEPSIFGTLLTRALDRDERHRLGAEFTPRAYVERLVRPTIEEPVRERWTMVQAEVLQLRELAEGAEGTERTRRRTRKARNAEKKAVERLREFHDYLRSIRVLDPACGSGNFLYVSLSVLKEIELEVIRELESITGQRETALQEVGPEQFFGIEIKPWAREVAELCLWVGHHQWWRRTHGHAQPPEPVLRDTGTLECRDAVLAWDEIREVPEKSRPDPTPRIRHPVTGELVPDPEARLMYHEYVGARQAEWPEADFIVGNPPYMGNKRMRDAFGDGYVDALRAAYSEVPESADYVMYWWHRAARRVAAERTLRAGLITTNSITQSFNRILIEKAVQDGAHVRWAIADHPWVDDEGGAAVRVAMTVVEHEPDRASLAKVDAHARITAVVEVDRLNSDLTAHADVVSSAQTNLLANEGLSSQGVILVGKGFVLSSEEAEELIEANPEYGDVVRPYRNAKDLTSKSRNAWVIDFGLRTQDEAREYEVPFEIVRTRVKPQRDTVKREATRKRWWRYAEARPAMRESLFGLPRYIAIPRTAKHLIVTFLDAQVVPDAKLIAVASGDSWILGILSSEIHRAWAFAAGSRHGVGNDLTYNHSDCFAAFPFPEGGSVLVETVRQSADQIDRHRMRALERDDAVTMTGMYNVVEKLRTGEALTPKERKVHEVAACGVLGDLHDELDRLVADAYGWPWPMKTEEILARLVALHDERVEEERRGIVRWLRPEYQVPRFGDKVETSKAPGTAADVGEATPEDLPAWPDDAIEQLTVLREAIDNDSGSAEEIARRFRGANQTVVEKHLDTLAVLGAVARDEGGHWKVQGGVATASAGTVP